MLKDMKNNELIDDQLEDISGGFSPIYQSQPSNIVLNLKMNNNVDGKNKNGIISKENSGVDPNLLSGGNLMSNRNESDMCC